MGKVTKSGEYSIGTSPYKKRKRKREITRENIRTQKEIIDDSHRILQPMMYPETPKRERVRQERSLILDNNVPEGVITKCTHEESMLDTDGLLVCRYCGVKIKKKKDRKEKIIDLFCVHRKTKEFDKDHIICTKCGAKFKK